MGWYRQINGHVWQVFIPPLRFTGERQTFEKQSLCMSTTYFSFLCITQQQILQLKFWKQQVNCWHVICNLCTGPKNLIVFASLVVEFMWYSGVLVQVGNNRMWWVFNLVILLVEESKKWMASGGNTDLIGGWKQKIPWSQKWWGGRGVCKDVLYGRKSEPNPQIQVT